MSSINFLRPRLLSSDLDRRVADITSLLRASGDRTRCTEVLEAFRRTRFSALDYTSPDQRRSYVLEPGRDGWDEV